MKKENKKGMSEVVGYLLLVSFAVFMSVLVYGGLKTYVPTKTLECPDGVSIFVQSAECEKTTTSGATVYNLDLAIKNNGRYNIAGYFIHASVNESQIVATLDLVPKLVETKGAGEGGTFPFNNAVLFAVSTTGNFVNVSETAFARFNGIDKKIYSIDILPIRFQKDGTKLRMVSCGKAIVRETVNCA